jgi:hypothetical protein
MITRKVKWVAFALLALLSLQLVIWLMADHDYAALAAGGYPRFTPLGSLLADGGSVVYYGFGYTLSQVHSEMQTPTGTVYRVGPRLSYWLPVAGRDGTTIQKE